MGYRHIATFEGKHNTVKSLCLMFLSTRKAPVSLRYLAESTGSNYNSLAVLVGRWVRWHYVLRSGLEGDYRYKIGARGSTFLTYVPVPLSFRFAHKLGVIKEGSLNSSKISMIPPAIPPDKVKLAMLICELSRNDSPELVVYHNKE
jgi:hypothetical protein